MALIYKSGQGYWVRVMTAVVAGTLVLAAAAWGYDQAGSVNLPIKSFTMELTTADGSLAAGDSVDIIAPDLRDPERDVTVGSAIVSSYTVSPSGSGSIEITDFSGPAVAERGPDAVSLRAGDADSPSFSAIVRARSVQDISIFSIQYLQIGVSLLFIIMGAIGVYWFVGINRKTAEFLIATDGEMKKVNWSTRKEILGSTQVVIVASFLIAGILFGIDWLFANLFRIIGVLEG